MGANLLAEMPVIQSSCATAVCLSITGYTLPEIEVKCSTRAGLNEGISAGRCPHTHTHATVGHVVRLATGYYCSGHVANSSAISSGQPNCMPSSLYPGTLAVLCSADSTYRQGYCCCPGKNGRGSQGVCHAGTRLIGALVNSGHDCTITPHAEVTLK